MFARDWRGVASAPAEVLDVGPTRCVSNTVGAADDGSGVVAVVGKDRIGRLVDLSGQRTDDLQHETFGHDLPNEHTFDDPGGVCLRQQSEDPNKAEKEGGDELDLFAKAKGALGSRDHLTAPLPEKCCVADAGHHACFLFQRIEQKWTCVDTLGRMERGDEPYELAAPRGCAWDADDQIYVADSGNHRVQIFDRAPLNQSPVPIDPNAPPPRPLAFTLNAAEPCKRGYIVKYDDRTDAQKAEDAAIEQERLRAEAEAAEKVRVAEIARLQELGGESSLEEETSDDEDTTASPTKTVDTGATAKRARMPWALKNPTGVAVRHAPAGLKKMGLGARGRCTAAWERDSPFWYLGRMSRKEARDTIKALKPGAWRVRVEDRRSVELVLCYVGQDEHAESKQHVIKTTGDAWQRGPFRSMVQGRLALDYYAVRDDPDSKPRDVDPKSDYLLEVVELDEMLEVLCTMHNLSYPLRGDPWGARPCRTVAVADTGHDRVALFQYACKRGALFRACYRYLGEVRGDAGVLLKEPGSVAFSRDGDLVVGDARGPRPSLDGVRNGISNAGQGRRRLDGGRGRERAGRHREAAVHPGAMRRPGRAVVPRHVRHRLAAAPRAAPSAQAPERLRRQLRPPHHAEQRRVR